MNRLVVLFALACCAQSFSQSPRSVISGIESSRGVECSKVDTSSAFCLTYLCFYNQVYACSSETEMFQLKMKLKDNRMGTKGPQVRKVIYL